MSVSNSSSLLKVPGLSAPIDLDSNVNGCKYFTWREALHDGERVPSDSVVTANIIKSARAFDSARELLKEPIRVTSYYRDYAANIAAGGVPNSNHLSGCAVDFYCDGLTTDEIYNRLHPVWTGGLGWYPTWCHIDIGAYARWEN